MRTTPHALLTILFLIISFSLLAQQPTKPKAKAKTKTQTTRSTTDTTGERADPTTPMITDSTTMQGGGGGAGTGGALPYTAGYSSQFTIGNPEHSRMVLNIWKDYDNNTLDRSAAMFADTVRFEVATGQVIRGRDSVINAIKQMRGQFTSANSSIDAWLPVRSTDRNEDWVLIWGRENNTTASGTTTNIIHEIWRINRDGKIDYVSQYAAKPTMQ